MFICIHMFICLFVFSRLFVYLYSHVYLYSQKRTIEKLKGKFDRETEKVNKERMDRENEVSHPKFAVTFFRFFGFSSHQSSNPIVYECIACSRLPDGREREKKMRAKNEWGLGSRRGASPRSKPPLAFPTHFFRFPDYLGAWNGLTNAMVRDQLVGQR